jgi:hypothetical protein
MSSSLDLFFLSALGGAIAGAYWMRNRYEERERTAIRFDIDDLPSVDEVEPGDYSFDDYEPPKYWIGANSGPYPDDYFYNSTTDNGD